LTAKFATGLCEKAAETLPTSQPHVFSLNVETDDFSTAHQRIYQQSYFMPRSIGYACEIDGNLAKSIVCFRLHLSLTEDWQCPEGYVMALGSCYRAYTEQKTRMQAELQCRKDGGTLAKARMPLHVHFLNELARNADLALSVSDRPNSKYWLGYLRDVDGAENPYNMFTRNIQGESIDLCKKKAWYFA